MIPVIDSRDLLRALDQMADAERELTWDVLLACGLGGGE